MHFINNIISCDERYRLAVVLVFASLTFAGSAYPCAAQQESPPAPGAPRQIALPRPAEKILPNSLRVIVIEDHDAPLVSVKVVIKNGGEVDPPQMSGLAEMTAGLLTKGTTTKSATETAAAIELLGGDLAAGAAWDSSQATVTVMQSKLEPAIAVLADVVRNPLFKEDELERLRQQTIDALNVGLSQSGQIASLVAARVVFGDGPYGQPLGGTPQSVARIKRDDVIAFHARNYSPENAILVFSGDITTASALKLAESYFGAWKNPAKGLAPHAPPKSGSTSVGHTVRVVVINMPNAGQAAVVLARSGISRSDPDYYCGLVANSLFGGGYSSRLNQEIRIKRGLSYGAGSSLSARRWTGPFVATTQTKNESAAEVASLMLAELKRLAEPPLPEAELQPRRANLIGNYGRALETTEGLAGQVASLALHGLSFAEINDYIKKVESVTEGDVRRFAASRLKSAEANLIIAGDAPKFLEQLRKSFARVEVIEKDDLDLESAKLRKSSATK